MVFGEGIAVLDGESDKKKKLANRMIANLYGFWKITGLYIESRMVNFTVEQHMKMSESLVEFLNKYSSLKDMRFWQKLKYTTKCNVAHLFSMKDQYPMRIRTNSSRDRAELFVLLTGSVTMVSI